MPLTQDQKDQLTRIFDETDIPKKFLNLLKHAMIGWENTNPTSNRYGIILQDGVYKSGPNQTCCMMGSALIDKPNNELNSVNDALLMHFDITYKERIGIIFGFDGDELGGDHTAFDFAQKIRQILNPKL